MWINLPGLILLLTICSLCGMVVYSEYQQCDPIATKRIQGRDQVCVFRITYKLLNIVSADPIDVMKLEMPLLENHSEIERSHRILRRHVISLVSEDSLYSIQEKCPLIVKDLEFRPFITHLQI